MTVAERAQNAVRVLEAERVDVVRFLRVSGFEEAAEHLAAALPLGEEGATTSWRQAVSAASTALHKLEPAHRAKMSREAKDADREARRLPWDDAIIRTLGLFEGKELLLDLLIKWTSAAECQGDEDAVVN